MQLKDRWNLLLLFFIDENSSLKKNTKRCCKLLVKRNIGVV